MPEVLFKKFSQDALAARHSDPCFYVGAGVYDRPGLALGFGSEFPMESKNPNPNRPRRRDSLWSGSRAAHSSATNHPQPPCKAAARRGTTQLEVVPLAAPASFARPLESFCGPFTLVAFIDFSAGRYSPLAVLRKKPKSGRARWRCCRSIQIAAREKSSARAECRNSPSARDIARWLSIQSPQWCPIHHKVPRPPRNSRGIKSRPCRSSPAAADGSLRAQSWRNCNNSRREFTRAAARVALKSHARAAPLEKGRTREKP